MDDDRIVLGRALAFLLLPTLHVMPTGNWGWEHEFCPLGLSSLPVLRDSLTDIGNWYPTLPLPPRISLLQPKSLIFFKVTPVMWFYFLTILIISCIVWMPLTECVSSCFCVIVSLLSTKSPQFSPVKGLQLSGGDKHASKWKLPHPVIIKLISKV